MQFCYIESKSHVCNCRLNQVIRLVYLHVYCKCIETFRIDMGSMTFSDYYREQEHVVVGYINLFSLRFFVPMFLFKFCHYQNFYTFFLKLYQVSSMFVLRQKFFSQSALKGWNIESLVSKVICQITVFVCQTRPFQWNTAEFHTTTLEINRIFHTGNKQVFEQCHKYDATTVLLTASNYS